MVIRRHGSHRLVPGNRLNFCRGLDLDHRAHTGPGLSLRLRAGRRDLVKVGVLEAIGENDLKKTASVDAALAANDRVKYYMSLLQMAQSQAEQPASRVDDLRRERLASGVQDASLDNVVANARRQRDGWIMVPQARQLLIRIAEDMRVMAMPVLAEPGAEAFGSRLEAVLRALPPAEDDMLETGAIARITRAGHGGKDSLHQLVMDLHKALNALQASLARETLDGAAVYHLAAADRPLVRAFMAGVNRTAPLKFDHPGLGTTATRSGSRLVIQNDIGTTDAHVIVIHVEGQAATLTYTDVHIERLRFLQAMLRRFAVSWSGDRTEQVASLAEGQAFHLTVGSYTANDTANLSTYLEFLGSRLVFLIDWNRARKQLRGFMRGGQRTALLQWAADEELGHRAFLQLGGARLINEAIEATAGSAMHFGDRLCDVLGDAPTSDLLRFALRAASEGLRAGQSQGLIRDRIRTELQLHFSNEGKRLLRLAGEHAGLVFEIATLVRDGVDTHGDRQTLRKHARRARRFEHDADLLVVAVREAVRRRTDHQVLLGVLEAADDAADQLEEAAFLLELLASAEVRGGAVNELVALSDLLVEASQEWIKALGHAVFIDGRAHEDADDFLVAIDRITTLEHQADDAERALRYAAVKRSEDFRQLHLYGEVGRCMEAAADALKRASLITRDYVLGAVLGD
jgi:uncharacterized protein Yka (UPF0111/DUF47 family)